MMNKSHVLKFIYVAFLLVLLDLVSTRAMAGELTAFGTDYLYTNGVKRSWTSPDLEDCQDRSSMGSWAYSLIGWLPLTNNPEFRRYASLIYRPEHVYPGRYGKDSYRSRIKRLIVHNILRCQIV